MNSTFTIDIAKLQELNNLRAEAFFKYLKRVTKNNTPIVLKGTKKSDYWECDVTECAVPTSLFPNIKLPASDDRNAEGTDLVVQLTSDLVDQFISDTTFTFKESSVEIKRGTARIKLGYSNSSNTLLEQVKDFQTTISNLNSAASKATLKLTESSEIASLLKELKTAPEASIFVDSKSVTLLDDTVVFRTKNTADFESVTGESIYINMYLANLLSSYLEYSHLVEMSVCETGIRVKGFDENGNVISENHSPVYDTDMENPSDDDLASILPNEGNSQIVEVDLKTFIEVLEGQKSIVANFTGKRNLLAKVYKNGNGITLGFDDATSTTEATASVILNVGDVDDLEPSEELLTEYLTVLPINLLKNSFKDSLNLRIIFEDNDDTVVVFQIGDSKILSGKCY